MKRETVSLPATLHIADPMKKGSRLAQRPYGFQAMKLQAKFLAAKSQLTSLSRKVSTNLGRRLR